MRVEQRARQIVRGDHASQSFDKAVIDRRAAVKLGNPIAPPLQADLPGDGLADRLRGLGDFVVERVEDVQLRALRAGREQRGEIAVEIDRADDLIPRVLGTPASLKQKGRPVQGGPCF